MKKEIKREDLILYLHGASAFQLLNAGVELNLFDLLHKEKSQNIDHIIKSCELSSESAKSLTLGLTSIGLIEKNNGEYKNSEAIEELFENGEYDLFKKMTIIQSHIMYLGQVDYVESLKQNNNIGVKRYNGIGNTIYERLNYDKKLKKVFYDYMEAYSAYALPYLLKNIDLKEDKRVLDVGGGGGHNSITIAKIYPNLNITLFDIKTAEDTALKNIKKNSMENQITYQQGNMFKDKFPDNQDCVMFLHQLVIWGVKENKYLLEKAYKSLDSNGKVIIFSSIANDNEKGPLMAGLDSVYFKSVAAGKGMIYSFKEYEEILKSVGFNKIEKIRCNTWTPHGIIIGYK